MKYKLVIFDCDGTLVDTVSDVAECFDKALRDNGFGGCSQDDVARLVGKPLKAIVRELIAIAEGSEPGLVSPGAVGSVAESYRRIYSCHPKGKTAPFPGITELVDDLICAGTAVAVHSNKPEGPLCELMERCFPNRGLQVMGYIESRPAKPNPAGVLELCSNVHVAPGEAIYIGDTEIDLLTAREAGLACAIVAWGQGCGELWQAVDPGFLCDTVDDLRALLL